MSALMVERRAADEAGRQESLFEALEPPRARNPWAPPEPPAAHDRDAIAEVVPPRDARESGAAPHGDPHQVEPVDVAAPPLEAPARDAAPRDTVEPSAARAIAPVPAAADRAGAPRRAGAPLAGPTLDDVMSRVWEGLVTGLPAACPVCHGEVASSLGGPLLGRCTSCGTAID